MIFLAVVALGGPAVSILLPANPLAGADNEPVPAAAPTAALDAPA
jgi:hypothetical protein